MPRKIEVSHKTIIFTVVFLIFIFFLYHVRDIILQVFVALLIAATLNPLVTMLSRFRIPRAISIAIVYVVVLGVFGTSLALLISPLVDQTTNFANSLPGYLNGIRIPGVSTEEVIRQFSSQLAGVPAGVVRFGISLFSDILSVLAVFIMAFYFLVSRQNLDRTLVGTFGEKKGEQVSGIISEVEKKLGVWLRGELTLMTTIGVMTFIGLSLLGIKFVLPLALLAGILEIVPTLGPILAAIPAIIVGFGISPLTGVAVAALAFLIQQVENYVLVPKIMEKSAGVSPLVTLVAILIGFKIASVAGAILSIPVVITLTIIYREFILNR